MYLKIAIICSFVATTQEVAQPFFHCYDPSALFCESFSTAFDSSFRSPYSFTKRVDVCDFDAIAS